MKTFLFGFLAVILGFVVGSCVNMGIVVAGPALIPPPPGADTTTAEGLRASIHLFQPRHFLAPFLAHALGTLAGAVIAYLVATKHRAAMAYVTGVLFLAGGIAAAVIIPAPTWFKVVDVLFAYGPMAWLGTCLARRLTRQAPGSQTA